MFGGDSSVGAQLKDGDEVKQTVLRTDSLQRSLKPCFDWKAALNGDHDLALGADYTGCWFSTSEDLGGDDSGESGTLLTNLYWMQKLKAAKANSSATQMLTWAREYDLMMVTGGDMFGPACTGIQAHNITALVDLLEWPSVLALRTATSNAGEVLSWSGDMNPYKLGPIGIIEAGTYPDVILVHRDPL